VIALAAKHCLAVNPCHNLAVHQDWHLHSSLCLTASLNRTMIRIGGLLPLIAGAVPSAAIDRAWQLSSHDALKMPYNQGGSRETEH